MNENTSSFGKRLKEMRTEMDMTLDEFSKLLDIPAQTLNRYELNQRIPKIDTVKQIADKLNVTSDYLLGKTEYRNWEELVANLTQLEALEKYISSLGYKISQPYLGGISGVSSEDAEEKAIEADNDLNFPCWDVTLEDGQTFTVTISEHMQLTERVKNLIVFELESIKNNGYFARKEQEKK